MSVWIEKKFAYDRWFHTQDQFENIFMLLGGPKDMMLVSKSSEDYLETTLVAEVPNDFIAKAFAGFSPISKQRRPETPILLVGHVDEYEKHFEYPKRSNI